MVTRTHSRPSGPAVRVPVAPARAEARRRALERRGVDRPRPRVREEERVVERVGQIEGRARLEPQRVERELGAALRRHEQPPLDALSRLRFDLVPTAYTAHGREGYGRAAGRGRRGWLPSAGARARRHPQRGDRRARRPREDDPRRRDALAVGLVPREPGRRRARHGLDGPRAREGHHDPREEHRGHLPRRQDQHRRHAGTRRLRRGGRAGVADGRRRAAPRRRERGPAAADALRAAEGARGEAPGDCWSSTRSTGPTRAPTRS